MNSDRYSELLNFKEIANSLHDAIFIASGDGTTLFINEAYTRITGINPEEIVGNLVSIYVIPRPIEGLLEMFTKKTRKLKEEVINYEIFFYCKRRRNSCF